jgi:hypothetical protein
VSGFKAIAKKVTPDPILKLYRNIRYKTPPLLNSDKLKLIDFALGQGAKTFADLGGMWRVNGGYSVYCADHGARQVTMVDFHATPEFLADQQSRKNLAFLQRNFALAATSAEVNKVDCVLLFDVLLHQVKPDWNEVLRNYAPYANQFLIYNQQFTGAQTVRLIDQGQAWYLRHVPHAPGDTSEYSDLFEKADELHPRYTDGRTYRDMHDVWQWGITDDDLKSLMSELGFQVTYERDCGEWPGTEEIRNKAFVFQRTSS